MENRKIFFMVSDAVCIPWAIPFDHRFLIFEIMGYPITEIV